MLKISPHTPNYYPKFPVNSLFCQRLLKKNAFPSFLGKKIDRCYLQKIQAVPPLSGSPSVLTVADCLYSVHCNLNREIGETREDLKLD